MTLLLYVIEEFGTRSGLIVTGRRGRCGRGDVSVYVRTSSRVVS